MTLTPCQREYQEISRSWAWRGPMVPQCANDGSYEPKQCDRTNCFCVNKHGIELEGTRISRLEAGKLSCRLTGKFVVVVVVVGCCWLLATYSLDYINQARVRYANWCFSSSDGGQTSAFLSDLIREVSSFSHFPVGLPEMSVHLAFSLKIFYVMLKPSLLRRNTKT